MVFTEKWHETLKLWNFDETLYTHYIQHIISESIKVPKFHNENYCRMTSDLMDDVQEDVRWMLGSRTDDIEQISNKYQTYF